MNLTGGVRVRSLDAESAVLGACLISEDAVCMAVPCLTPIDFTDINNRSVFQAISTVFTSSTPVDVLTVADELRQKGNLDRIGGTPYLYDLAESVPSTANVEYYVDILRELSQKRKLLETGRKITDLASSPEVPNETVISQASQLLLDASENNSKDDFTPIGDVSAPAIKTLNDKFSGKVSSTGYKTGLTDIDSLTGGMQPGSLTILAARPAMGKTALALNFAQFGGTDNKPAVIFSLEMPAQQLALRMMSAQSGVPLSGLINGTLSSEQFKAVKLASEELAQRQIYISDNSTLSTTDFMIKARRFKTKHPDVALIIVDYLQLMTAGRRIDSRVLEVSEISRTLKAVARELNVPVLALSQLSRAPEGRPDKKPQLSDLRDSGAIEQDADTVILLYREDYYGDNENSDLVDSKADLRIAKNRNGATGVVHLTFKREITRFVNFGEV